jgi:hypothetical protein
MFAPAERGPVECQEVAVDQVRLRELSDQATVRLLNKQGTVSSNRGENEYDPSAAQLGLAA